MYYSESNINWINAKIFRKLGVHNRKEAALKAINDRSISAPSNNWVYYGKAPAIRPVVHPYPHRRPPWHHRLWQNGGLTPALRAEAWKAMKLSSDKLTLAKYLGFSNLRGLELAFQWYVQESDPGLWSAYSELPEAVTIQHRLNIEGMTVVIKKEIMQAIKRAREENIDADTLAQRLGFAGYHPGMDTALRNMLRYKEGYRKELVRVREVLNAIVSFKRFYVRRIANDPNQSFKTRIRHGSPLTQGLFERAKQIISEASNVKEALIALGYTGRMGAINTALNHIANNPNRSLAERRRASALLAMIKQRGKRPSSSVAKVEPPIDREDKFTSSGLLLAGMEIIGVWNRGYLSQLLNIPPPAWLGIIGLGLGLGLLLPMIVRENNSDPNPSGEIIIDAALEDAVKQARPLLDTGIPFRLIGRYQDCQKVFYRLASAQAVNPQINELLGIISVSIIDQDSIPPEIFAGLVANLEPDTNALPAQFRAIDLFPYKITRTKGITRLYRLAIMLHDSEEREKVYICNLNGSKANGIEDLAIPYDALALLGPTQAWVSEVEGEIISVVFTQTVAVQSGSGKKGLPADYAKLLLGSSYWQLSGLEKVLAFVFGKVRIYRLKLLRVKTGRAVLVKWCQWITHTKTGDAKASGIAGETITTLREAFIEMFPQDVRRYMLAAAYSRLPEYSLFEGWLRTPDGRSFQAGFQRITGREFQGPQDFLYLAIDKQIQEDASGIQADNPGEYQLKRWEKLLSQENYWNDWLAYRRWMKGRGYP
ncbi:MAG: hypothetical protein COX40_01775, partial [Candidatus Omnitrophica bacterium CG23_combo_of_CG06-09_8_20_14_all_40_11]